MASTVLEHARQTHEEIETLTRLAAAALAARDGGSNEPLGARAPGNALEAAQLARQLVDSARERSDALADMYTDTDGSIRDTASAMRGGADRSALSAFYAQLRDVRELHRSSGGGGSGDTTSGAGGASALLAALPPAVSWTPEEARGTCLDMHAQHAAFNNVLAAGARGADERRVDYVSY
eukprot:IDg6928t1